MKLNLSWALNVGKRNGDLFYKHPELQTRRKAFIHRPSLLQIKIGRLARVTNLILLELYWEIKMLMEKLRKKIASTFFRK